MKFGLSDNTIKKIQGVFAKYPEISSVILYGSRAKGNYKNGSDIDLTIKGQGINLYIISKISNDLDDLLLPYKIDLSIFEEIENQELIGHIVRVGVEFYSKNSF